MFHRYGRRSVNMALKMGVTPLDKITLAAGLPEWDCWLATG